MINNNTNPLHVLLLGKTPPPVGGVTVSVLNLKKSLEKKGIKVTVFYKDIKLPKCDLVHVNYSKPLFRFFGIVLGKMLSKKVIFTIHGNSIKQNSIFNRLSIKICDGIIILNRTILKNNLEF